MKIAMTREIYQFIDVGKILRCKMKLKMHVNSNWIILWLCIRIWNKNV